MARRDTARLAAMSDPDRNRWFGYAWVLPPPLNQKRGPAGTGTANFESDLSTENCSAELAKSQARSAAAELFALGGAA